MMKVSIIIIIIIIIRKCLLISGFYCLDVGNHPDACGCKKVCCLYANTNMQLNVNCKIILLRASSLLKSALRRRCAVLVRTIYYNYYIYYLLLLVLLFIFINLLRWTC